MHRSVKYLYAKPGEDSYQSPRRILGLLFTKHRINIIGAALNYAGAIICLWVALTARGEGELDHRGWLVFYALMGFGAVAMFFFAYLFALRPATDVLTGWLFYRKKFGVTGGQIVSAEFIPLSEGKRSLGVQKALIKTEGGVVFHEEFYHRIWPYKKERASALPAAVHVVYDSGDPQRAALFAIL